MSTPTDLFDFQPTYSATATVNGYAYVTVVTPPSLVTSQASASATSDISYEDAFIKAQIRAQTIANSVAQNDANVITQSILLSGSNPGQGYTGPQGNPGLAGPQGPPGSGGGTGGSAGYTGPQGSPGAAGAAGPQGNPGLAGPQGPPGSGGGTGGSAGYTGPQGSPGAAGGAGPQGNPGLAGPQGNPGLAGPQGFTGSAGSGGGSSSGTTTLGYYVTYLITTSAVVGQPLTTSGYTQISSITSLTGFPATPSNMTVGFLNTGTGITSKSFITFTLSNITTSTTPTLLQQLVWPITCFTNPLSLAPTAAAASISNPALMLYSNSNLVSKASFQGSTSANTPIVGASNTQLYLDLTFKNAANLGGFVSNYNIGTGDNSGSVTFLGAFIYITFNNSVFI